jgi:hypothetical protein
MIDAWSKHLAEWSSKWTQLQHYCMTWTMQLQPQHKSINGVAETPFISTMNNKPCRTATLLMVVPGQSCCRCLLLKHFISLHDCNSYWYACMNAFMCIWSITVTSLYLHNLCLHFLTAILSFKLLVVFDSK